MPAHESRLSALDGGELGASAPREQEGRCFFAPGSVPEGELVAAGDEERVGHALVVADFCGSIRERLAPCCEFGVL